MTKYAANTQVSSSASRTEIEKTLTRYGASDFAYGWTGGQAMVGFGVHGRQVRFYLPLPDRQDKAFTHTPERGTRRSTSAAEAEYEKSVRQRWRALALVIKAKLEAVESGIVTFDEEFLAHLVLPGGQSVHDAVMPQVHQAFATGRPPAMLSLADGSTK